MRKIHESDIQPSISKSVYLLIAISLAFALFSLAVDLVFIAIFIRIFDLSITEFINSYYWSPLISSSIGFIFGIVAKAKIQEHVTISEQGCLADTLIYSNLVILVMNILSLFGFAYLFRSLD